MFHVYVLLDPRSHEPRYVGLTNDPRARLTAHIGDWQLGRRRPHAAIAKREWIRELRSLGLKPALSVIEMHCDESEAVAAELHAWHLLKNVHGFDLLGQPSRYKGTVASRRHYAKPTPAKDNLGNCITGALLRQHRQGRGISLREVVATLGVAHPSFLAWESGRAQPSSAHKAHLAIWSDGGVPVSAWPNTLAS